MATYTVRLNMLDSDPSTWGTWLDDAVGMTLPSVGGGENEIDAFMGYYPCILDPTNQTAREIKPNNYQQYLDGTSVSSSDGDTMVYFPNRGYRLSWHDANTLDVSVTNEPDQVGFVYMTYNGHPCNGIYIGAYDGYVDSNKLYSRSGVVPTGTKTISDYRQYAQARGSKYELFSFYPLTYLQCCALIKYRGNNIQVILGRGYVDANSNIHATGGADTRGLNFGENTGKYQCKLFGSEDVYGNVWNDIDGIVTDSNYHVLTSDGEFNDSGDGYTDQGACTSADATGAYHRPKATTSKMGFIPDGSYIDSSDTSYTTYFCDRSSLRTSSVMIFGGQRQFNNMSGLFTVYASNPPSSTHATYCSRLSYFDVDNSEDDDYKNIRIKIDNRVVATQEIIDKVSITYGCTDGSAPAVGTTYSPHCDVEINSNEIYGDSSLDAIKMGAIFVVECELESGTYTPLGRFEIGQPVQITDDYAISFSGEGMLGSVLTRKKMNWANMEQYSDKGVLTVAEALELVHIQFPTITIQTPSSEHLPSGFSSARIVVPTSLKKWKKKVVYKKRFVKLTVRDFIAGIAVMMGGNVVEYGSTIRIVTMKEALGNISSDSFTADFYEQDYTYEKRAYAPKEVILKTYETTPVQSKKKSGTTITHGYCYTTECDCASVYNPTIPQGENKYTVNVDCQWIGRSFEAFYFSGSVSGDSGIYDDATPIHEYPSDKFDYTPCTFNFNGWNEAFKPSFFINVQGTRKNTETQVETPFTITAYIMDMTFEWNGTISVSVNSGYSGESSEITVTIGTNELSSAWDDGTNVPELAVEKLPSPTDLSYVNLGMDGDGNFYGFIKDGLVHLIPSNKNFTYYTTDGYDASAVSSMPNFYYVYGAVLWNNEIYSVGDVTPSGSGSRFTVFKYISNSWQKVYEQNENYWSVAFVINNTFHILMTYNQPPTQCKHYIFDGESLILEDLLTFHISGTYPIFCILDNVFHFFGQLVGAPDWTATTYHLIYDGDEWRYEAIGTNRQEVLRACAYKGEIYLVIKDYDENTTKLYVLEDNNLVELMNISISSKGFSIEYQDYIMFFMGGGYYKLSFDNS